MDRPNDYTPHSTPTTGRRGDRAEGGYLTARDVATILRCSARYVCRLAQDGAISHIRVGKMPRFTEEDVAEYVAYQRREAIHAPPIKPLQRIGAAPRNPRPRRRTV